METRTPSHNSRKHNSMRRGEDSQKPSFNHYLGWARFQRSDLGESGAARSWPLLSMMPMTGSWLHLGASLLGAFQIPAATAAFAERE